MQNLICQWYIQFVKKFGLRLTDRRKCYFLIFAFSLYPNFKWILSKTLQWISRVPSNFYYVTNIIDLHFFDDNETAAFKFFLKFARICILFFFLNERNITTSLLMIHLKGPVVHYANLSSSSKIKPFLYYGTLNVLFFFIIISYLCLF